ncbi:helix-turn-helix domain-containing protein [Krasilnikovia sp. M28-CT-15]|uniref:helix-turn-helix domain-containing protein n=1 Tax=Krasilnikovia sp. M28-CT-15 TaxID=3373540 RepID=UPI0038768CFE
MSRPERVLTPDRSPQHRFGYELRALRKARRLSQDTLGKLVHVSGDLVRLIELGERQPTQAFAESCDRELNAPGVLARLFRAVEEATDSRPDTDNTVVGIGSAVSHGPDHRSDETIPVEMLTLTGETVSLAINRRALVGGALGIPAVLFLGGATAVAPTMADGTLSDVLHNMRQMRTLLAMQDNTFGPGAVLPTAVHQASILQQLRQAAGGKARDDLISLQSAYGELCGWLADDLGDPRSGQHWIDRALEWGHESGDTAQTGYVLMRKAQRAADADDAAAAVGLARAAVRSGGLPQRVVAAARQYEAQGHALTGDDAAFQEAIEAAYNIVAHVSANGDESRAAWCTPAYVAIHEAAGLMRLHRPELAAAKYEDALAGWSSDMHRDLGIYRGRLGAAYAAARQPEPAAAAGRSALAIAQRTGSGRILAELQPLATALAEWRSSPAVRDFLAELRAVVAARATGPGALPPTTMGRS